MNANSDRRHALVAFVGRTALFMAASALPVSAASVAEADEAAADGDGSPITKARELFDAGKALLGEGQPAKACTAFEESQKLAPAGGTLLNLAECRIQTGAYASAVDALRQAQELANAAGRDDANRFIHDKLELIAPKVAHLRLGLPALPASDLRVTLDGRPVDTHGGAVEVPVDPGVHALRAEAKGRVPFATEVTIRGEGAFVSISLPTLAPIEPPPRAASPSDVKGRRVSPTRIAGVTFTVAGGTALVVGTVLGALALSRAHHATVLCPQVACSDREGVDASHQAGSLADAATGAFFAGGGLTIAGLTMVVLSPPVARSPSAFGIVTEAVW